MSNVCKYTTVVGPWVVPIFPSLLMSATDRWANLLGFDKAPLPLATFGGSVGPAKLVTVWLWDRALSRSLLLILHSGTQSWMFTSNESHVNYFHVCYLLQDLAGRTLLSCENIANQRSRGTDLRCKMPLTTKFMFSIVSSSSVNGTNSLGPILAYFFGHVAAFGHEQFFFFSYWKKKILVAAFGRVVYLILI